MTSRVASWLCLHRDNFLPILTRPLPIVRLALLAPFRSLRFAPVLSLRVGFLRLRLAMEWIYAASTNKTLEEHHPERFGYWWAKARHSDNPVSNAA